MKPRLLYLDNLRTAVITLVVLGHVAVSYGAEGDWYLHGEGQASPVALILMLPLMAIGAAFMMGLLFLIAGYFTPRSYDRKGPGPFLVDRLKRLGIPLLLFAIVINPLIEYLVKAHYRRVPGLLLALHPALHPQPGHGRVRRHLVPRSAADLLHLLHPVAAADSVLATAQRPDSGAVPSNRRIALFALVLGLATFLVRIWAPVNTYFEPEHLEFAHFPQYVAMFAVGTVAYRRNWLVTFSDAQARPWRWVALVCVLLLPVLAVACGGVDRRAHERGAGGVNWISLAYSVWEGFMCLAMVITVLVWFRQRFNHQGRLARAMSEASFAVYVLHPIIIVPLALA